MRGASWILAGLVVVRLYGYGDKAPELSVNVSEAKCAVSDGGKALSDADCQSVRSLLKEAPAHSPEKPESMKGFFEVEVAGKRYPVNYRGAEECRLLEGGATDCKKVDRTPLQRLLGLLLPLKSR